VGSWFRLVDIDADGDLDLFCNGTATSPAAFYRNRGTQAQPTFLLEKESEAAPMSKSRGTRLHGAMAISFGDLDGNGISISSSVRVMVDSLIIRIEVHQHRSTS